MVKQGEYFYTSWGYDQTNIDYLVVVSVSPSGKTAACKMVSPIHLGSEGHEDVLTPGVAFGEPFAMRVKPGGTLRGSYPYCQGGKRLATFWPTELGGVHRQTMPEFGH